jgi:hypothetical protein
MSAMNTEYFDIEDYYVGKKKYCMTFFKRAAKNGKRAVITKYGSEKGNRILDRVKMEFENLLPNIPYVGQIDILQRQMLLTVIFLAFYRVLKDEEKIGSIWSLCNNFNRETLMNMPGLVRKFLKMSTFSKRMKNRFKNLAEIHKKKNLADQWDYVEGDGITFDYGMNMKRCAKLTFLKNMGAEEFAPYVCLIDKNFAECCDYGLKRTMVLAEGADYCDFRLSKNGPVEVVTSVNL